jgi:hypothetical protein
MTLFDLKIKRRDDIIPPGVHLKYRVTSTYNGSQYVGVINDVATTIAGVTREGVGLVGALCDIASFISAPASYLSSGIQTALETSGRTFGSKSATIDFEGPNVQSITINTINVATGNPATDSPSLAMWKALHPALNDVSNLALYTGSSVTAVDDNGAAVDLGKYKYILLDPHVPQWLLTDPANGPLCTQATISGVFTYDNNAVTPAGNVTTGKVQDHPIRARATLIRIAGGTYEQVQPSEIIPYGLAGFIYNIEKAPQYEGSVTLQEPEVTDLCPLGNNLNITNSANAEWATMAACVQNVTYDLLAGRTTVNFGPPAHLGAKDFTEQLRANRGPRWYYLI